jgi:hypothetical protein
VPDHRIIRTMTGYYTAEESHRDLMNSIERRSAEIDRSMRPNPALEARKAANRDQFQEALMRLIVLMWIAFPTAMAAKAGTNWYALTNDKGASAERAAQALVRWARFQWMFLATTLPLVIVTAAGGTSSTWTSVYPHMFDIASLAALIVHVTLWGVIYCRMAEFSLFKRGPIQALLSVPVRLLDGVHTWAIGLVGWLPALLLAYMAYAPAIPNV